MKALISCKQAVDFISKKEEHKISSRQRFHLWKHLAVCSLCRTFSRQNRMIIDVLKTPPPPTIKLSQEDKDSLSAMFR